MPNVATHCSKRGIDLRLPAFPSVPCVIQLRLKGAVVRFKEDVDQLLCLSQVLLLLGERCWLAPLRHDEFVDGKPGGRWHPHEDAMAVESDSLHRHFGRVLLKAQRNSRGVETFNQHRRFATTTKAGQELNNKPIGRTKGLGQLVAVAPERLKGFVGPLEQRMKVLFVVPGTNSATDRSTSWVA